jgi:hypothetical protein
MSKTADFITGLVERFVLPEQLLGVVSARA